MKVFLLILFYVSSLFAANEIVVEPFESTMGCSIFKADGAELQFTTDQGKVGNCLKLTYDLGQNSPYVVVLKDIQFSTEKSFKLEFYIKGESPDNTLEFKLVDDSDDFFWKKFENFKFSKEWQKVTIQDDDLTFAWGPVPKDRPGNIRRMEFGISRGSGGKGTVFIDELTYVETVPKAKKVIKNKMKAEASSSESTDLGPDKVLDKNLSTRWSSTFSDSEWISIDLGESKQLVGIIINWEAAFGKEYDILLSKDHQNWKKVYSMSEGVGGEDNIDFDNQAARYIKVLGKKRGTGWGYSIFEIVPKTEEEPFGVGREDPEMILRTAWNFKVNPQKILYLPKSWEDKNAILILSGTKDEYSIYLNNNLLSAINLNSKKPITVDIKKYMKPGKANSFNIKVKKILNNGIIDSLILLKDKEALSSYMQKLRKSSPLDYYKFLANLYPDGYFPLWLNNKQGYWTVVGTEDSFMESLLSDVGIISAYTKGFSIIPFLYLDKQLITFTDVKKELSLENNYLPIPCVKWEYNNIEFAQKIFSVKKQNESLTYISYTLKNKTQKAKQGKLFLTLRPFEVSPPWQYGGLTQISSIAGSKDKKIITINETKGIINLTPPTGFGVTAYNDDDIVMNLSKGNIPSKTSVNDSSGFASGVLEYDFNLAADGEKEYLFLLPLDGNISQVKIPDAKIFAQDYEQSKKDWETKLSKIEINIPEKEIIDTLKANVAYLIINKDGAALQPGSRCYENSWIRDGSEMCGALLRTGHEDIAKKYIEWIAQAQLPDGEIPCIVGARDRQLQAFAKEWKEYDGQGAFIFAVADYYHFTKDKEFVKEMFPYVLKALKYLENLRAQMMTDTYKGTSAYGILPKGASHEGYIGNPQQSLWDDYWALKGWKEAQILAKVVGEDSLIKWMKQEEEDFRKNLLQDIKLVQAEKKINYIPSSIGLGDFDPTSTSISVFPTYEYKYLDHKQLMDTFNTYYKDTFYPRIEKGLQYSYTPYEIRTINTFLFLGEKEKALKMVRYFLQDMRPREWKHWAEVVHADPVSPVYIGDMPHTWIGGEFVSAIINLFVYEEDGNLILGAGIDEKWLSEEVSIKTVPTYYGTINYSLQKKTKLNLKVWGDLDVPGKIIFKSPVTKPIKNVTIDGKVWKNFTKDEVVIKKVPAEVVISY